MKNYLFTFFVAVPLLSFSQNKSSIDLVGGIEYSYRSLNTSSQDPIIQIILENRKGETGKLNFRTGFNYNRRLTERWWIRSGVRLASIGYKSEKKMGTWPSEHDTIPDPTLPHELQLVYDYLFFEFPLMARFEMGKGKWGLFAEAGISPNLYYGRKVTTKTDLDTQSTIYRNEVSSPSKLNLSGNLSLGLHYRASERVALFFQPIFRYHFSPLVDAPIREHLYNFGAELGARCGLNKN